MNAQERQRREIVMRRMLVPFMALIFVCAFLADTNMLRADRQQSVVYDSGYAIVDMQKQSLVLAESPEHLKGLDANLFLRLVLPILLLGLHAGFNLPTRLVLPVRRPAPALRQFDAWGLLPFPLAPPRLA